MGRNPWPRPFGFHFLSVLLLALTFEAAGFLPHREVDALKKISGLVKLPFLQSFSTSACEIGSSAITCNCSDYRKIYGEARTVCHVTNIYLSSQQLTGFIPLEVANLEHLEFLDLSYNNLYGSIPAALGNLTRLKFLYLSFNNLNGKIPTSLKNLARLQSLSLSNNLLSGSIPAELGDLRSLSRLSLWVNELNGSIPNELGNITTLKILDLTENMLYGVLPEGLGKLNKLQELRISQNRFTGGLAASYANLTSLQVFVAIGINLSEHIPEFIGNWTQLTFLNLIGNNLEGPLPAGISRLTNLTGLFVSDLSGSTKQGSGFPDISKMKSLNELTLRNCSITGEIPDSIGKLASLKKIDLSFNKLTGEVPMSINHLNLSRIYLTNNMLSGPIPSWGRKATRINADFSNNDFTNASFEYLNKTLPNVNLFHCCSPTTANLTYPWQRKDFSCASEPKQKYLYINCGGESVNIGGNIYEDDSNKYGTSTSYASPKGNWAYSSTGDFLIKDEDVKYTQNRTCDLSMTDVLLYKTVRISSLSLKYYGLCLLNGGYNVRLHFAEILFTDDKNHTIKGNRVFDVFIQDKIVRKDYNIKKAAGGPNKAVVENFAIDVENNLLKIHLYWAGKGTMFIPPYLYGPLISAISVTHVPEGSELSAISIAGIVGSTLLFIIFVLVFFWKMGWLRGKELRDEDEELKKLGLLPGGIYNFRQIKAATQNFNSVKKIGEGGFGPVYKGDLPNGTAIAVKQLSSKSRQGIREFVTEVGTISALQHENLVRLLGCCAEDNQLLLVYEYMENNSLHHALSGHGELKSKLNWPTRFKICLGIAKGLKFLHEESKLKIVHRDIKPTNILLDKDLNAKISDFGFAKLYEEENTQIVTKIAGTTGYMAPEYAMRGYLTSKVDVYSFGAVVLEIVSGRSSSNYSQHDEGVYLLDLAYVLHQKGKLLDLIDPALGTDYSIEEATRVLDLAMLCTNLSPTLRPTMSEVVSVLEGKTMMKAPPLPLPYSTDDFEKARAVVGLSLSTQSGSRSTGGTSNPFSGPVETKEGEILDTSL